MSDLIRREDAIDAISKLPVKVDNLGYTWMIANDVLNQIDSIPSAEPEWKWIPVSEALPEEKQNVLVTTIDGERKVSMLIDFTYWWNIGRGKVIAWMPLPEPWRGEK